MMISLLKLQALMGRVEGLFPLSDLIDLRVIKARGQVDKFAPTVLDRAVKGAS